MSGSGRVWGLLGGSGGSRRTGSIIIIKGLGLGLGGSGGSRRTGSIIKVKGLGLGGSGGSRRTGSIIITKGLRDLDLSRAQQDSKQYITPRIRAGIGPKPSVSQVWVFSTLGWRARLYTRGQPLFRSDSTPHGIHQSPHGQLLIVPLKASPSPSKAGYDGVGFAQLGGTMCGHRTGQPRA